MGERHVRRSELSGYLQDTLSPGRAHAVEQHVSRCPGCARRLRASAQVEEVLYQVAEALGKRRCWAPVTRRLARFAVAAAIMMVWCRGAAPGGSGSATDGPPQAARGRLEVAGPPPCATAGPDAICREPSSPMASMAWEPDPDSEPGANLCSMAEAPGQEPVGAAMCGPGPASFSAESSGQPLAS